MLPVVNVSVRVQTLSLILKQNIMYKHDFVALLWALVKHKYDDDCSTISYLFSTFSCLGHKALKEFHFLYLFVKSMLCGLVSLHPLKYQDQTFCACKNNQNVPYLLSKFHKVCNTRGYCKQDASATFVPYNKTLNMGGHAACVFSYSQLEPYMLPHDENQLDITKNVFKYADHVNDVGLLQYPPSQFVYVNMPLQDFTPYLSATTLLKMAKSHGCHTSARDSKKTLQACLKNHSCPQCNVLVGVFSIELPRLQRHRANLKKKKQENSLSTNTFKEQLNSSSTINSFFLFPPEPLTSALARDIADGACKKMTKNKIEEGGCAVCGELVPIEELSRLKAIKNHLHVLKAEGISSIE